MKNKYHRVAFSNSTITETTSTTFATLNATADLALADVHSGGKSCDGKVLAVGGCFGPTRALFPSSPAPARWTGCNTGDVSCETSALFKGFASKLRAACAGAALTLVGAISVSAAPVTYKFDLQSTSATLNGVSYSGPMTIFAQGDTNNVQIYHEVYANLPTTDSILFVVPLKITLTGFGTFSFLDIAFIHSYNQDNFWFQIELGGNGQTLISGSSGSQAANYELGSLASFGPSIYSEGTRYLFQDVATTAGIFSASSNGRPAIDVTFTAVIQPDPNAVPEPASLSLFATASAAVLLVTRRRKLFKLSN